MRARDNPFASHRTGAIPFIFQEGSLEAVIEAIKARGFRAGIGGPHGSGKSTLLREVRKRLAEEGFPVHFIFLSASRKLISTGDLICALRTGASGGIVLIDGAEQLPRALWHPVRILCPRLVVTTHTECLLPFIYCCRPSSKVLHGLIDRLLGGEAERERRRADELYALQGGNIREVFRSFYDYYAGR
ncbi:MAG: hypothetical protein RDV48_14510 [Candidatus Eremiobacteraeota bacterium]|nr:hypothetical protein [Candidatus Eremiobacteraeota bacterium]